MAAPKRKRASATGDQASVAQPAQQQQQQQQQAPTAQKGLTPERYLARAQEIQGRHFRNCAIEMAALNNELWASSLGGAPPG